RHPALSGANWELLVDLHNEAFNHNDFSISANAGILAFEQKADPKVAYNVACAFARDSNVNEALAWIERALDAGFSDKDALLSDPDLEAVRSLPEFSSLVTKF